MNSGGRGSPDMNYIKARDVETLATEIDIHSNGGARARGRSFLADNREVSGYTEDLPIGDHGVAGTKTPVSAFHTRVSFSNSCAPWVY